MGMKQLLWAFFLSTSAFAADPPPINQSTGTTYVPSSAQSSPTVQQKLGSAGVGPTNIGTIPTPDTIAPPVIPSAPGAQPQQPTYGQYRTASGVKLEKMLLDRYKQSVVRVTTKDMAGNELSRAMGVGVGKTYIATSLSLILGNAQQWADRIEISHHTGNTYTAKIAYVDEEKNLVMLSPEAHPSPLPSAREQDERPNIDVFTFSFQDGLEGEIEPKIHRGIMAAVNPESGLLSVSGSTIKDDQAGSAIINTQGELVGMLLPRGRGVLNSTLQKMSVRAQKATPIEPNQIGVILGRGVMVDPKTKSAYPTISAALDAIKKGEAPKPDPSRYNPAKNRIVAPAESDKVVIKVMPGNYKEGKTIVLPSNLSLSGSGPDKTVLLGSDPNKPVLLLQGIENSMVSGFRIVPANLQSLKAPTVILSKASKVTLLGNVLEAKGGVALWANESNNVEVFGNSFARGQVRALSCDRSSMKVQANAFMGDWPIAVSVDRSCNIDLSRSLFFENKNSVTISSQAGRVALKSNSFIRSPIAVKLAGNPPNFQLDQNLFFECAIGFNSNIPMPGKKLGRNAIWKSKFQANGRPVASGDLVRTEPKFEAPESYDFRLRPGQGQLNVGSGEEVQQIGAFQLQDILGEYTQQVLRSLSVATGESDLASLWGLE